MSEVSTIHTYAAAFPISFLAFKNADLFMVGVLNCQLQLYRKYSF